MAYMRRMVAFAWLPLSLIWAGCSGSTEPAGTASGGAAGMTTNHGGAATGAAAGSPAAGAPTATGGKATIGGSAQGGSTTTNTGGTATGTATGGTASGGTAATGGTATTGGASTSGGDAGGGDAAEAGGAGADTGAGGGGSADDERQAFAYVSTYLGGVAMLSLDPASGIPRPLTGSPVNKHQNEGPYFIATDHAGRFVYTADPATQRFDAWQVAQDGTLPESLHTSLSVDFAPISFCVGATDKFAYAVDGAAIQKLAIDAKSGELSLAGDPFELDADAAYAAAEPLGRFLYVSGGIEGGIWGYTIDPDSGALSKIEGSPFGKTLVRSGALVFRPDGAFLFSSGNGLNAFAIKPDGALETVEGSPFSLDLASDYFANDIAVDPRGQYLYTSEFLQTQHISGYKIDKLSGKLEPIPGSPRTSSGPYSLAVEPSGRFIYVGSDFGMLAVFAIDRQDGSFKELDESPFPLSGLQPQFAFVRPGG
jgi:6-phosphogluconolactonase (cycloisomerase 2 family)